MGDNARSEVDAFAERYMSRVQELQDLGFESIYAQGIALVRSEEIFLAFGFSQELLDVQ